MNNRNLPSYTEIVDPILMPYIEIMRDFFADENIQMESKKNQIIWFMNKGMRQKDVAIMFGRSEKSIEVTMCNYRKGNEK